MAQMTVGEMLTNLCWVVISKFEDIKCSGNWMWNIKKEGQKMALYRACKELTKQQSKVLACVEVYLNKTGFPPTRAEICKELGFKSPNADFFHPPKVW